MRKRTFIIDCSNSNHLCQELRQILKHFVDTAFPANGSECARATRSSLIDLADKILKTSDLHEISTRQRPLLKTAINWYFEEISQDSTHHQELLALIAKKKK
ncbi:MAG TPA: hypothetical protein EYG68_10740 [Leucothrix mucor]|nr:hypothetical protein [Leucothrix mucor]